MTAKDAYNRTINSRQEIASRSFNKFILYVNYLIEKGIKEDKLENAVWTKSFDDLYPFLVKDDVLKHFKDLGFDIYLKKLKPTSEDTLIKISWVELKNEELQ